MGIQFKVAVSLNRKLKHYELCIVVEINKITKTQKLLRVNAESRSAVEASAECGDITACIE